MRSDEARYLLTHLSRCLKVSSPRVGIDVKSYGTPQKFSMTTKPGCGLVNLSLETPILGP